MNYVDQIFIKTSTNLNNIQSTISYTKQLQILFKPRTFNRDISKALLENKHLLQNHFSFLYTTNKPWCSANGRDYCPLVIAFMSFIIITSLLLIIFLCAKTSFKCKQMRKMSTCLKKIFTKRTNTNLNLSTSSTIRSSSSSRSFNIFNRLSNRLRASNLSTQSNSIWYTDLSKYGARSMPQPPPTYAESQHQIYITQPNQSNKRIYPRKYLSVSALSRNPSQPTSSNVNNAFSMENMNEFPATAITQSDNQPTSINIDSMPNRNATVFPSYRCLTLTTSPSTRATLQRLSSVSRQLLERNETNRSRNLTNINCNNQIETLSSFIDEVPPPYEAVVTNFDTNMSSNHTSSRTRSFMSSLIPNLNINPTFLPNYQHTVRENLV